MHNYGKRFIFFRIQGSRAALAAAVAFEFAMWAGEFGSILFEYAVRYRVSFLRSCFLDNVLPPDGKQKTKRCAQQWRGRRRQGLHLKKKKPARWTPYYSAKEKKVKLCDIQPKLILSGKREKWRRTGAGSQKSRHSNKYGGAGAARVAQGRRRGGASSRRLAQGWRESPFYPFFRRLAGWRVHFSANTFVKKVPKTVPCKVSTAQLEFNFEFASTH